MRKFASSRYDLLRSQYSTRYSYLLTLYDQARRRYLRNLVKMSSRPSQPSPQPKRRAPKSSAPTRPLLNVLPGYTVLVVDTNILLSSLSVISTLVDSNRWTIVVPLAVITELDGISKNSSPLGNAATDALTYLTTAVPQHTTLKVQTSKGNYLRTLSVRSENIDFSYGNQDRNMDDLILRAAAWQAEHFFDHRTLALGPDAPVISKPSQNTSKVVILSFDRNRTSLLLSIVDCHVLIGFFYSATESSKPQA